ncbi:hypothetical protein M8037_15435 [Sinorhizobium meliloti]|uniref:hypothetical protein n=1 Tax=Rhizobium meliloti TaxID=382 RepID=UPI0020740AE3|nr:hypothetical protein [Sinorhizobium meliloti]MCM5690171.1 hypothetical protein [Sinorhizobium meliloti]
MFRHPQIYLLSSRRLAAGWFGDAVVIARYIADLPTLEMLIDPLREKPIRQHRKICSSGGTPTAVA